MRSAFPLWFTLEGYCKSGNIRGTLIFAKFTQNSASTNSKTRKIFAIFCMHILDTQELCIDHVC